MTAFLITENNATVSFSNITLQMEFQPTWSNLQAYQGYFHSNDELLNQIWYSGAYTLQSNSVPVNTGRAVPFVVNGWANNGALGKSPFSNHIYGASEMCHKALNIKLVPNAF